MSHCKWCFGEWKYRLSSKTGAGINCPNNKKLKAYFNAAQVVVSIYQATPNASGTFPDGRRHLSIHLDPSSYPHGWLVRSLVISFLSFYQAFSKGQDLQLEPICSYRNYIAWLKKQDLSQLEAFWRKTLQGFLNQPHWG